MQDKLHEDLNEILITGAGKSEVKEYLLNKGYDLAVIENELNKIPFVKEKAFDDLSPKKKKMKKIVNIGMTIVTICILLKIFVFNQLNKKTYAEIRVSICNTSKRPVMVETNLQKGLCSLYGNGGCLSVEIGDKLPTDYLYTGEKYIKISVDGKSKTYYLGFIDFTSENNFLSRAEKIRIPGPKGFFSNQEYQHVSFNITSTDIAEGK